MRISFFLFLTLILVGCSQKRELDANALYKYIHDESNGLIKVKEDGRFKLAMVWKPNDLIVQQQVMLGTQREYDSLTKYFSKYLYFTLEMTYNGKDLETGFASDPGSFANKISFLSSELSQNIQLKSKQDTLAALECIYTRSYGMGASQCLIVFEKPKDDGFVIEVTAYPVGFGKQDFEFNLSDIQNAPRLKTRFI